MINSQQQQKRLVRTTQATAISKRRSVELSFVLSSISEKKHADSLFTKRPRRVPKSDVSQTTNEGGHFRTALNLQQLYIYSADICCSTAT